MTRQDPTTAARRTFLRAALLTGITAVTVPHLTSCSAAKNDDTRNGRQTSPSTPATGKARSKVLLAYFSRPGENYYYGGRTTLKVGNTEVMAGKIVVPFTTHAMSGLGTTARDYTASCPGATFAEGLAVQGEEVEHADDDINAWLQRVGLTVS
ncbi:hypothetical protein [Nonomuraea sp. NPDC049158]|uniref:flavodoxin n=1 Tax=Nonomuraea sp. NPDC049158 TaxID=3155649 RepID=UPI0033FFC985